MSKYTLTLGYEELQELVDKINQENESYWSEMSEHRINEFNEIESLVFDYKSELENVISLLGQIQDKFKNKLKQI